MDSLKGKLETDATKSKDLEVNKLVNRGKKQGYVTIDEIMEWVNYIE